MPNPGNMQTCVIAALNLFIAVGALADVEAIEVVGDVVSGHGGIHIRSWGGVVGGPGSVH